MTICETRVFGDLERQIRPALRFLRRQQRELERLAQNPSVSDLRLTFPYCPEDRMHYDYFPPELLALAGSHRIGIALSVYPGPAPGDDVLHPDAEPNAAPNGGPRRHLAIPKSLKGRHR